MKGAKLSPELLIYTSLILTAIAANVLLLKAMFVIK